MGAPGLGGGGSRFVGWDAARVPCAMFWLGPKRQETPSERARREHAEWLTRALSTGRVYPRIPTREVERGGFDHLRSSPKGRAIAARWWRTALERVDTPR